VEVARPLLEGAILSDSDLLACLEDTGPAHRRLIAARKPVSEVVAEAITACGDLVAVATLLANAEARLSNVALERVTALSRTQPALIPALLRRSELRPSHAYILFWWAQTAERRLILQRFAVSREILQDAAADIFAIAAEEGWQDPLARKALQFIERRQRNRAAIEKSPYDSLEAAVDAAQDGLTRELVQEIAYLAGLKPTTGAKILTDLAGEPLAILCKATGLPRPAVLALWRGLRRPEIDGEGRMAPALERTLQIFDEIAVDRAQTVLRYWNWALSSALTPALVRAIREGDEESLDPFSAPQRAAMLALGADLAPR
jgi:uncharacterized protein (DUF2336 family)